MRFTVGRPAPISHQFEDVDGAPIDPGSATVTVVRAGSLVPVVTAAPAVGTGGVYTYSLPSQSQGVYTISWTGGAYTDPETVEFVGRDLFSIREFRLSHDRLADSTKYPGKAIRLIRDLVSQEFEVITGRSFVPRTARLSWSTDDELPRADVAAVTLSDATGAPVTPGGMEGIGPWTYLPYVAVDGVLTAEIDYGFRAVPEDVRQAAILRARDLIFERDNGIPDRATSYQPGDGGTYILSQAGRRGATTGIPDVDAVLARYTFSIEDGIGGFW